MGSRAAAVGALWGLGLAGLLVPHLPDPLTTFAAGAAAGACAALFRPSLPALAHPAAATLAAVAGVFMVRLPEPTFFLLVPTAAAALAWPLGPNKGEDRPLPAWMPPASFALGAAVFFVQAANRHWQFGSGAKDMGLFVQQHWLIAHGYVPFNTVMGMHMLADHMTFLDFLVAPLFLVHAGAETLLLVQALGVASGVFPIFWTARRLLGSSRAALALAWAWLLSPDVHMGIMFDYNPSLLGATGLLWTAWALLSRGPVAVLVAALLTCAAKTNFPPYVAVLALGLVLLGWLSWRRGVAVAALALAIFAAEIRVISPMFREGGFRHWDFPALGETPGQIAAAALTRPDRTAALLVSNPDKRRSLLLPLLGSGYLGLAQPLSLVLQLPNWGERLLSAHRTRWWGYYYGMPAAATAILGALFGWRRLQTAALASRRTPVYLLSCALLAGLLPPYRTPAGNTRSDLYYLRQPYTSAPEDVRTQRAAVAFIGRDPRLRVAAQYNLLPHLAQRPFVVELDQAPDADVVALQIEGGMHPGGRPGWRRQVRALLETRAFHVAFCRERSVVLRRGRGRDVSCPAWEEVVTRLEGGPAPPPTP